MQKGDNPYDILGVAQNCDYLVLQRAYRNLSLAAHPERKAGDSQRFARVANAYELLFDPASRHNYDLQQKFRDKSRSDTLGYDPEAPDFPNDVSDEYDPSQPNQNLAIKSNDKKPTKKPNEEEGEVTSAWYTYTVLKKGESITQRRSAKVYQKNSLDECTPQPKETKHTFLMDPMEMFRLEFPEGWKPHVKMKQRSASVDASKRKKSIFSSDTGSVGVKTRRKSTKLPTLSPSAVAKGTDFQGVAHSGSKKVSPSPTKGALSPGIKKKMKTLSKNTPSSNKRKVKRSSKGYSSITDIPLPSFDQRIMAGDFADGESSLIGLGWNDDDEVENDATQLRTTKNENGLSQVQQFVSPPNNNYDSGVESKGKKKKESISSDEPLTGSTGTPSKSTKKAQKKGAGSTTDFHSSIRPGDMADCESSLRLLTGSEHKKMIHPGPELLVRWSASRERHFSMPPDNRSVGSKTKKKKKKSKSESAMTPSSKSKKAKKKSKNNLSEDDITTSVHSLRLEDVDNSPPKMGDSGVSSDEEQMPTTRRINIANSRSTLGGSRCSTSLGDSSIGLVSPNYAVTGRIRNVEDKTSKHYGKQLVLPLPPGNGAGNDDDNKNIEHEGDKLLRDTTKTFVWQRPLDDWDSDSDNDDDDHDRNTKLIKTMVKPLPARHDSDDTNDNDDDDSDIDSDDDNDEEAVGRGDDHRNRRLSTSSSQPTVVRYVYKNGKRVIMQPSIKGFQSAVSPESKRTSVAEESNERKIIFKNGKKVYVD